MHSTFRISVSLALAAILAVPAPVFAEGGYVGEDLGLDLYRKVDRGVSEIRTQNLGKRLKWNAQKLNSSTRLGTKFCRNKSGANIPCFDAGNDFTAEELALIESGRAEPIFKHLKRDVALTSEAAEAIASEVRKFSMEARGESASQTKAYQRMGNLGLFNDGSVENSSYDLMKDMETLHSIVFAKELPYNGKANQASKSVKDWLKAPPVSSKDPEEAWNFEDGNLPDLGNASDPRPTVTPEGIAQSMECSSGWTVGGIDSALAEDLSNQLGYGTSAGTYGTSAELASGSGGSNASKTKNRESKIQDTYECSQFFCIKTKFLMYDSLLLGGGKNYSIEDILDQNFKIMKDFGGSSFVQAGHTNNFFELLLRNLRLPDMAHLGVVVSTLPPPILNLKPGSTPRGNSPTTSEQKEFEEMTVGVFKDYGIEYERQNDLQTKWLSERIRNTEALSTDKLNTGDMAPAKNPRAAYAEFKRASWQSAYADSFSTDLVELRAFTQTFIDRADDLNVLCDKFNKIPSQR